MKTINPTGVCGGSIVCGNIVEHPTDGASIALDFVAVGPDAVGRYIVRPEFRSCGNRCGKCREILEDFASQLTAETGKPHEVIESRILP